MTATACLTVIALIHCIKICRLAFQLCETFALFFFVFCFVASLLAAARAMKLTVFSGDEVTLPCSTSSGYSVIWWYQPSEVWAPAYIYDTDVYDNCRHRISDRLLNQSTGNYTLVLMNAAVNDSGLYVCKEKGGARKIHTIVLNVTSK